MTETIREQLEKRLAEKADDTEELPVEGDEETRESLDAEPDDNPRESESGESPEPSEPEPQERYTPETMAAAIGWETADLYNALEIPVDDGESLTLGELKDRRHEIEEVKAQIGQERAKLNEERQALEQHRAQILGGQQAISKDMAEAQSAMAAVQGQYESVDWDKLEEKDPGRAANLRQKLSMQYANAQQQFAGAQQRNEHERGQLHQQYIGEQRNRLLSLKPELKDTDVKARFSEALEYASSYGITKQQLEGLGDAGAVAVLMDGLRWRQHQAEVEKSKDKVRAAPKPILKPGAGGSTKRTQQKADQLVKKAHGSGKRRDKLAAAKAVLRDRLSTR